MKIKKMFIIKCNKNIESRGMMMYNIKVNIMPGGLDHGSLFG